MIVILRLHHHEKLISLVTTLHYFKENLLAWRVLFFFFYLLWTLLFCTSFSLKFFHVLKTIFQKLFERYFLFSILYSLLSFHGKEYNPPFQVYFFNSSPYFQMILKIILEKSILKIDSSYLKSIVKDFVLSHYDLVVLLQGSKSSSSF